MARKDSFTDQSKILSRRALVLIDRDMTAKTPRVVWQHEIPVLEAVFGEGHVAPVETSKMDEGYSAKATPDLLPFNKVQDKTPAPSQTSGIGYVFVGDPRTEYERITAVYGNAKDGRSICETVYGRFQDGRFSAVVGAAVVEDLPEAQLRELIRGYGFIPALSQDSSDAERAVVKAKLAQLAGANQSELVKLAEEIGVSIE